MPTLDNIELACARARLAQRCLAVAAKYTPDDVTVSYRRSLTGCAWARGRRISVPRPVTRRALHIYLHEVAHVVLRHFHDRPVYQQEFEAEQWAFEVMQKEGIGVADASIRRAKAYVAQHIFLERHNTVICSRAAGFAQPYL